MQGKTSRGSLWPGHAVIRVAGGDSDQGIGATMVTAFPAGEPMVIMDLRWRNETRRAVATGLAPSLAGRAWSPTRSFRRATAAAVRLSPGEAGLVGPTTIPQLLDRVEEALRRVDVVVSFAVRQSSLTVAVHRARTSRAMQLVFGHSADVLLACASVSRYGRAQQ